MAQSTTQTIRDIYPVFVPNQPLESKVLNELSDYFSQQDQLTRQHLIGVGVLNGLKVSIATENAVTTGEATTTARTETIDRAETTERATAESATTDSSETASVVTVETTEGEAATEAVTVDETQEDASNEATKTTIKAVSIQLSKGDCLTPNGFYLSFPEISFTHYKDNQTSSVLSGAMTELVADTENNGGILLSQTPLKVSRTDAQLKEFLSGKALVMVAELNERVRQGLIHYNVDYREKTLRTRFFLLPVPALDSPLINSELGNALIEADAFAFLKQRRALKAFLIQRDRLPSPRRFGYHRPLNDEGEPQADPLVSLSAITNTETLRSQYEQRCRDEIAVITQQLTAVDALITYFPSVSEAIEKQKPKADANRQIFPLFPSLENKLDARLNSLLQDPQSLQAHSLQNYTDFLDLVAIAAEELGSAMTTIKGYAPAAKHQKFLMLGCPTFPETGISETSATTLAEDAVCSDFVHYADTQGQAAQLNTIARLYLRLYYLCDSFVTNVVLNELVFTPKVMPADLGRMPLSQQPIPYYINQSHLVDYWHETERVAGDEPENRLLYQSANSDFYGIEGYQNKSCQEIWTRLKEARDRYNLSFTVIFLKLDSNLPITSTVERDFPQFHQFAKQHPGLDHLGGVPKGGTFVVLYEKTEAGDQAIADFALPYYYVATESNRLPAPPSFSFNYPEAQTVITDQGPIEITLVPEKGTVEGEGASKADDGTYRFNAEPLQQTLTEETELSLTAQWENHQLVTPAIRVLAPPFAQFWIDDTKSKAGEFDSTNRLALANNAPVRLRRQNKGGDFSVLAFDDGNVSVLGSDESDSFDTDSLLFSENPLTFLPQNVPENVSELILQYTLKVSDRTYSTSLVVQLHQEESEAERTNRVRNIIGEILPDQIQPHLAEAKRVLNTAARQEVENRVASTEIKHALNVEANSSVEDSLNAQLASTEFQQSIDEKVQKAVSDNIQSQLNPEIDAAKEALDARARDSVATQISTSETQDALNALARRSIESSLQTQLASEEFQQDIDEQVKKAVSDNIQSQLNPEIKSAKEALDVRARDSVATQISASETKEALNTAARSSVENIVQAQLTSESLQESIDSQVETAIRTSLQSQLASGDTNRLLNSLIQQVVATEVARQLSAAKQTEQTGNQPSTSGSSSGEVPVITESSTLNISEPLLGSVDLDEDPQGRGSTVDTADANLRNFEGDNGLLGNLFRRRNK